MASIARIPFTQSDDAVINSLTGWMLFMAILHSLGALACLTCGCFGAIGAGASFSVAPAGAALLTMQMLIILVMGVLLAVEGMMMFQARSSLAAVVQSDVGDQAHLSAAFKRLKFFFMLELIWFGVSILFAILGLVLALVAPELAGGAFGNFGQQGGFGQPNGGSW